MALVTGNVSTFGRTSVPMLNAVLDFIPSEPATTGAKYLLSGRKVRTPIEAGTGAFTVDLQPTETTNPGTYYKIQIVSLDSEANFTYIDFPEWRLYVPEGGGDIGALLRLPPNPSVVWVGDSFPEGFSPAVGVWWLNTDPGSADYGWLMEWE